MTDVLMERGNVDTEMHAGGEHQEEVGVRLPQAQEPPESRRQEGTGTSLAPSEEVSRKHLDHRFAPPRTVRQELSVVQSTQSVVLVTTFQQVIQFREWSCFCLAQSWSQGDLV